MLSLVPPASKRIKNCRLQFVLGARNDLANQCWKKYIGKAAVRTAPSDMPVEVLFVFISWKVRYYDQAAFTLASRSAEATDFALLATAVDEFKTFSRDGYDTCYELTASNARRHFDQVFCIADYRLLR